jgi:hypothetical protein
MTDFNDMWTNQQIIPSMPIPSYSQMAVWDQVQTSALVPRRRAGLYNPYAQTHQRRDVTTQFRELQRHYTISGEDNDVKDFLEADHTLFALLSEAVQPLNAAFGNGLLQVRVQKADDDSLLKVAVQLPADFAQPECALQSFDDLWWINNCHRSAGALVFDYELRDAV